MQDILILNKDVGETPLECMNRFRSEHPEYEGVKMTYAGRLDPMAEGLLLVLAGEKVHHKDKYLKLPKTYECAAIIGVGTDTYDVLGMPALEFSSPSLNKEGVDFAFGEAGGGGFKGEHPHVTSSENIEKVLSSFIGTFSQEYPPYSSKTIKGKQLHAMARDGELEGVEMPAQMVTVESITDISTREISLREISRDVIDRISKVRGDFRQLETITAWKDLAQKHPEKTLTILTFTIAVSGGTYIRGIVHELGKKLYIPSSIWKLRRTKLAQFGFSLL